MNRIKDIVDVTEQNARKKSMQKSNKPERQPKLTIKTLALAIDLLARHVEEVNNRMSRFVEYDKEKQGLRDEMQMLRNRFENSESMFSRANARAEILGEMVDRLLGPATFTAPPDMGRDIK